MHRVGIVGATGIVGQQFLVALDKHPWFQVAALAASERSAGKTYGEALRDPRTGAVRWYCEEPPPAWALAMPVVEAAKLDASSLSLVFSAVESDQARELEPGFARTTPVISTASAFRYEEDVPIIVPGVNNGHVVLLERQRKNRGWKGFITAQPNCTTIGLAITLKPLQDSFGVRTVLMTSMQALSGAGRSPGVLAFDILDNVIPFIFGEEEKVQRESLKILGRLKNGSITPADIAVSCTCTRVNVKDGHTESVFLSTAKPCDADDAAKAMSEFDGGLHELELPSAPEHMIVVRQDPYRPQPRLDRDTEGGMATVVGRLRADTALPNGLKYVLVSHNTRMGAAKGAVLAAELLAKTGYL
ncbi:MAG: aspartate-semialdehyde dehydrogenase [Dehalococcoidia bacterium]|nr:aspartate-semialdehyde dehydrogenase [Dehalococcoidia bacterium]